MPIHPQDPSPSALTTPDHAPILPSILDAVVWLLADQHRLVAPDMYARRNALDALNQHLLDADMASVRVETERLRRRDPPIAGLASYAEDVAALAAIAENAKDRYARARDLIREPLRKLHAPKESPPSAPATATKETVGAPAAPPAECLASAALKAFMGKLDELRDAARALRIHSPTKSADTVEGIQTRSGAVYTAASFETIMEVFDLARKSAVLMPAPIIGKLDEMLAEMRAAKVTSPTFTATMTVDGQVLGEVVASASTKVASPAPAKGDYTPETIGEAMKVLGLTQKAPPDPLLAKLDQMIALLTKLASPPPSVFGAARIDCAPSVFPPPAPGFPGSTA